MKLQNIRLYNGDSKNGIFYALNGLLIIGEEKTEISVDGIEFTPSLLKTEIFLSNGQRLVYVGVPASYENTHPQIMKRIKFLWERMMRAIEDLKAKKEVEEQ